jgi:hypothetical protein
MAGGVCCRLPSKTAPPRLCHGAHVLGEAPAAVPHPRRLRLAETPLVIGVSDDAVRRECGADGGEGVPVIVQAVQGEHHRAHRDVVGRPPHAHGQQIAVGHDGVILV